MDWSCDSYYNQDSNQQLLLFIWWRSIDRSIEVMEPWLVGVAILTLIGLCSTSAALKIQVEYECNHRLYDATICFLAGNFLNVKMHFDDLLFVFRFTRTVKSYTLAPIIMQTFTTGLTKYQPVQSR